MREVRIGDAVGLDGDGEVAHIGHALRGLGGIARAGERCDQGTHEDAQDADDDEELNERESFMHCLHSGNIIAHASESWKWLVLVGPPGRHTKTDAIGLFVAIAPMVMIKTAKGLERARPLPLLIVTTSSRYRPISSDTKLSRKDTKGFSIL